MFKNLLYRLLIVCLTWGLIFPTQALAGDDGTSNLEFSVMGVANYAYLTDLSNDDAYIFRDKMLARNWIKYMEGYETQVGEASFGYAAPSDIMFLLVMAIGMRILLRNMHVPA